MKRLALFAALLVSFFAASAQASTLYTYSFDVTFSTALAGNPIESFAFSLTTPSIVADGQSPAFASFTMTDGTNTSAPLTTDLFENASGGAYCFMFGSATTSSLGPSCNLAVNQPNGASLLITNIFSGSPGSLPTTTGVFSDLSADGIFYISPGVDDTAFFNVALTITQTPDPAPVALIPAGLTALFVLRRRLTSRP